MRARSKLAIDASSSAVAGALAYARVAPSASARARSKKTFGDCGLTIAQIFLAGSFSRTHAAVDFTLAASASSTSTYACAPVSYNASREWKVGSGEWDDGGSAPTPD